MADSDFADIGPEGREMVLRGARFMVTPYGDTGDFLAMPMERVANEMLNEPRVIIGPENRNKPRRIRDFSAGDCAGCRYGGRMDWTDDGSVPWKRKACYDMCHQPYIVAAAVEDSG